MLEEASHGFNPLLRHWAENGIATSGMQAPIFKTIIDNKMADFIFYKKLIACNVKSEARAEKTYKDYFDQTTNDYSFYDSEKTDESLKIIIYQQNKGSHIQTSKHESMKNMKKGYQENQYEVYRTEAICSTDEIGITENADKEFSNAFIDGLRRMAQQFQNPKATKDAKYREFKHFINDFGFFYLKQVTYGAAYRFESIYSSSSSSTEQQNQRSLCELNATYTYNKHEISTPTTELDVGVNAGVASMTAKSEFQLFSWSNHAQHKEQSSECSSGWTNTATITNLGLSVNRISTIGGLPGTFQDWIDGLKESEREPMKF